MNGRCVAFSLIDISTQTHRMVYPIVKLAEDSGVIVEKKVSKGILLIVSHGNDLEYLNIILNILEDQEHQFQEVKFLDLSRILDDQDTFHRPLLRLAGKTSPEQTVFAHLECRGYDIFRVEKSKEFESIRGIPNQVLKEIEKSIESALISRSGNEEPEPSKWLNSKYKSYKQEGVIAFNSVVKHLAKHPQISEIALVNGRFPCQRGVIEAANFTNVSWSSYERGSYEMALPPFLYSSERYFRAVNYWYAPFPAYARKEKQEAILAMDLPFEKTHSKDVEDWFLSRRQAGGTNRFAEGWKDTTDKKSTKELAVLFTSSVDEFAELDASWKEAEWKDQWDAFQYLIPILMKRNYRVVLRVHPNLANKPSKTGRASREAIDALSSKFPSLEVIEPSAKTNSYALLDITDLAIVWISTIGLEASQMGVRAICLSSSEYDLVADVKRWLGKKDVDFESLRDWNVDKLGSLKFIAGIFALDHKAKQLLPNYGVNPIEFGKGVALFSNKWAMRNTNNMANLVSIFLPSGIFLSLRKIRRQLKFSKLVKFGK
jgi:hypothetical protein